MSSPNLPQVAQNAGLVGDAFSGERRWWQPDFAGGRLRWELARGAFAASPGLAAV